MKDPPAKTQDYLKVIWDLHEYTGEKVVLSDVAERVGEKKPTASEAVKRLAARGLTNHESYWGISPSDRGQDIVLITMRRHRSIESLLVPTLGYTWDEVHGEAEKLEHAVSEEFTNYIGAMLGFPEHDSHGDSVPSASGIIANVVRIGPTDTEADATVAADRISDSDPELLYYLATSGVGSGTVLRTEVTPCAGMHAFVILDEVGDTEPKRIHVADSALWAIKAVPTMN